MNETTRKILLLERIKIAFAILFSNRFIVLKYKKTNDEWKIYAQCSQQDMNNFCPTLYRWLDISDQTDKAVKDVMEIINNK